MASLNDLDLLCLQWQGVSGFSRTRVKDPETEAAVCVSMLRPFSRFYPLHVEDVLYGLNN